MKTTLTFLVSLLLGGYTSLDASSNTVKTFEYDFISDNSDIGDIKQIYIVEDDKLFIVTHSHLKYSSWQGSIDFEESSIEEYKNHSLLIKSEYFNIDYDEEVLYYTKFQKNKNNYSALIFTKDEIDKKDITNFISFKNSTLKVEYKNLHKIKIETSSLKKLADNNISINNFHTTNNLFPLYYKKHKITKRLKTLSLLDSEINEVAIFDKGFVELKIKNKTFITRHLKIIPENQKPSEIWIADEKSNLPYIVRYKGSDEDGDYELILKGD